MREAPIELAGPHRGTDVGGSRWLLVAAVVGGVVLRIVFAFTSRNAIDSDEAIVGLMAQDMLTGDPVAFYWGQDYGGSIEAMVLAPFVMVFGTSPLLFRVVATLFTVAIAVVVWRIGLRVLPESRAAEVAVALFVTWPLFGVWWSMKLRGFYLPLTLLGLLGLLFVLRLRERPDRTDAVVAGVVFGLGWWQGPAILYFAVPAGVYVLVCCRRLLRRAGYVLAGFLLGSIPWWYANLVGGFGSLDLRDQPASTPLERLWGLVAEVLPESLGLKIWRSCDVATSCSLRDGWVIPLIAPLLYVAALGGLVVLIRRRPPKSTLLVICLAFMPLAYVASDFTWFAGEARYLFPLFGVFALVLSYAAVSERTATLIVIGALAISTIGVARIASDGVDADHLTATTETTLISELEALGVERGWAGYSLAYRVSYLSDRTMPLLPTTTDRGGTLPESFDERGSVPAFVFEPGDPSICRLEEILDSGGVSNRRARLSGGYFVVLPAFEVDVQDVRTAWNDTVEVPVGCSN